MCLPSPYLHTSTQTHKNCIFLGTEIIVGFPAVFCTKRFPGVYSFNVHDYLVYYKVRSTGILILWEIVWKSECN